MPLTTADLSMLRLWLEYSREPTKNESLFHAWEWLNNVVGQWPDVGWEAILWLIAHAEGDQVLERIGMGPLQHLVWFSGEFASQVVERAHADRAFYRAAQWVELDDEDVGESEALRFDQALASSPFANDKAA